MKDCSVTAIFLKEVRPDVAAIASHGSMITQSIPLTFDDSIK